MTLATTVVGLSFVFENTNLSAFTLFQNLASNLCACNGWLTDLYAVAGYEKNFIKSYFCACFNVQFFNGNDFAFFNAVLFTTGFDNCVHVCTSSLLYSPNMAAYESIYGAVSVRLRHGTLYNDLIILSEIKIDVKYFFDILEKREGQPLECAAL